MIALLLASQVARVVVFPDRAQVTRTQAASCGTQAVKVEFNSLPPSADPSSLRAQTSEGGVESVDVIEEPRATPFSAEVNAAEDQLKRLGAQLAALHDAQAKTRDLDRLAGNLEEMSASLISTEIAQQPDVKAWRAALAQTLQARLDAARQRAEMVARERELQRQTNDVRNRLARLGEARDRRERRAEVLVSCPPGKSANVELTYLVGGASWHPAYEARADDGKGSVALSLFATVQQSTGESWDQAQVIISTAVPSQDATPPEIQPLRVYAQEREPPKKVLVRRDEMQRHAEEGAAGRTAATGLAAEEEGLSVQLFVKGPADVSGDGTPARLLVGSTQLQAAFAWKTVPKTLPFVFRVADLVNTAPFPLLEGQVDLFREGAYLGQLPLERVAEGARFHLSFGLEEKVKVKRTVIEEIKRDEGLFKSAQRFHYAYKFEVENHLGRAENVELSEQIPVSELSDVEVAVEDKTTQGFARNAEDGIVTWKLHLQPNEKRELQLAFHVDVPSDYATGF
ncbi:MAG: mucoidy inhibitor MuiA family protein [Myxococcales bacterium]|nr:mucoidy inhibitor MuiA family protein [Myxococcales bacterium]